MCPMQYTAVPEDLEELTLKLDLFDDSHFVDAETIIEIQTALLKISEENLRENIVLKIPLTN